MFRSQVLRLRLELASAERIVLRRDPREYVSATLRDERHTYARVGLHLKGATGSFRSLDDKPSLTLSFDRFDAAQRFHGLRKIHLNNSVEDPAYLNELLGSELFRAAGVPAARATHALVDLNGRPLGLYVLKEGFTEEFLALHFHDAGACLYEPGPGHDINEPLAQKLGAADERTGLDALTLAALEPDLQKRWTRLQQTLDWERFSAFMALEVMLGHRDGYCLARNNFRVAYVPTMGRVVFIPHGMDQLFGRSPPMIEPRLSGLVARALLDTPPGREEYRRQFGVLFTNLFNPLVLERRVDAVATRLREVLPAAEARPFTDAVAALKARIVERHADVQKQLNQPEMPLLRFVNGIACLSGWRPVDEPAGGAMREVRGTGSKTELYIRAAPPTAASWRSTVRLPAGRYRFEGTVRTAGVEPLGFGQRHGAALCVSGSRQARSDPAPFGTGGTRLRVEFDVDKETEVQLGCELRARRGTAWFDAASLRLVQVTGR